MRTLIGLAAILSLLPACDLGESLDQDQLITEFALFNSGGWQASEFTIGDTVYAQFRVTNNSGRAVLYHYTGMPVVLEILERDSVVATSADGLAFPQVVLGAVLENGQSISVDWHAPNTPWSSETKILRPGIYRVVVAASGIFGSFRIEPPAPIQFIVYPGNV